MQKNEFLRQFFEILAGGKLSHTADAYNDIDFNISFSVQKETPVVVFTGEHSIFPTVIELPKKDHLMINGLFISILAIGDTKNIRTRGKKLKFSNLIFKYLKNNDLIEVDKLGNIEVKESI